MVMLKDKKFTEPTINTVVIDKLLAKIKLAISKDYNFRNANLEMTNSEIEIEKLEVWNGPSRPP